jgi:hypothetical protein
VEDRGDSLVKTVTTLGGNIGEAKDDVTLGQRGNLIVDRKREEIYTHVGGKHGSPIRRIDGRTGKQIEMLDKTIDRGRFGPDGRLYLQVPWGGNWLVCYDPDSHKFVDLAGGEAIPKTKDFRDTEFPCKGVWLQTTNAKEECHAGSSSRAAWMAIAPNGDFYIPIVPAQSVWEVWKKENKPFPLGVRASTGTKFSRALAVYDRDGRPKNLLTLPGLCVNYGINVGRGGRLYIALKVQPLGQTQPEGILKGDAYPAPIWGSLVKFDSVYDRFPVGALEGHAEWFWPAGMAGGTPTHTGFGRCLGGRCNVRITNMLWSYGGVAPMTGYANDGCICEDICTDLDGFDRSWVPAQQTHSVTVLDANGNVVVRIGSYGNADSRGKDSAVKDPKTGGWRPRRPDDPAGLEDLSKPDIALHIPRYVGTTDEALYVQDAGNGRMLRCVLKYQVEETVAAP